MYKTCRVCKSIKLTHEFSKDSYKIDGKSNRCKQCDKERYNSRKEYLQQYHQINRERIAITHKLNIKNIITRVRLLVLAYLKEHTCRDCGESNPVLLDFHHIDPSNKYDCVSKLIGSARSWNVVKSEIDKCIVLCANCHRLITSKEQSWYS